MILLGVFYCYDFFRLRAQAEKQPQVSRKTTVRSLYRATSTKIKINCGPKVAELNSSNHLQTAHVSELILLLIFH